MSKAVGNSSAKKGGPLFQKLSFLLILTAISLGFLYMVRHFVMPLLLAAVFTGLSYPLYEFLLRRLRKPLLAALASLLILILVILLPVGAVIFIAYREAQSVLNVVDLISMRGTVEGWIQNAHNRFPALFTWWGSQDVSQITDQAFQWAVRWIPNKFGNLALTTLSNVISVFLMLFMMFYFYMDGKRILDVLMRWSPLRDDYETILLHNFLKVSRATLKGILIIGVIQGTIGTVLFWAVGLGSPVFLGLMMVFCTVLPIVGVSVIWLPASLYLFFEGRVGAGIAVLIVGAVVISAIDNILRPRLVGKDIQMHDLMVLLSTLGGLGLFGLPGFVMGPILASLFLSIWGMFEEVFEAELAHNRVEVKEIPPE